MNIIKQRWMKKVSSYKLWEKYCTTSSVIDFVAAHSESISIRHFYEFTKWDAPAISSYRSQARRHQKYFDIILCQSIFTANLTNMTSESKHTDLLGSMEKKFLCVPKRSQRSRSCEFSSMYANTLLENGKKSSTVLLRKIEVHFIWNFIEKLYRSSAATEKLMANFIKFDFNLIDSLF